MIEPLSEAARLCGIHLPIFQAPMAGLTGPDLVAEVSNLGGLGQLGGLRVPGRILRFWIHRTRELTSKPFGVNLVPQYGGPAVFEASLRVVLEEAPPVVSLFFGDFEREIPRLKEKGITVIVQVGSVAEGQKAARDGADIVVAQGIESGGHVRGRISLMALVPAMVDAIAPCPVVAAGAIMGARQAAAALALGAQGVWCGTAFLATQECSIHQVYRDRLISGTTDGTEYREGYSYGWPWGTPHRVLPGPRGWNLLRFMGGGVRAIDNARAGKKLSLYAGQGVGSVNAIRPAREVIAELAAAFHEPQRSRSVGDSSLVLCAS